jgi:hypothetical protein
LTHLLKFVKFKMPWGVYIQGDSGFDPIRSSLLPSFLARGSPWNSSSEECSMVLGSRSQRLKKLGGWLLGISAVAFLAVATPNRAWADNIEVFDITGGTGSGGIFAGTNFSFAAGSDITVDTTTGVVESANITVDNSSGAVVTFTGAANLIDTPLEYVWYSGTDVFGVTAYPAYFTGFSGCQSCTGLFSQTLGLFDYVGSVTLTEVTSAPEPACLALLGGGLLALLAMSFRREQFE